MRRVDSGVRSGRPLGRAPVWLGLGAVLLAVLLCRANFLFFHCIVEMVMVSVAGSVAMIAWNTRELREDDYLLHVGIGLGVFSTVTLIHIIAHPGMVVLVSTRAEAAVELRFIAHVWLALVLFTAPRFVSTRLPTEPIVICSILVAVLGTGAALHSDLLGRSLDAVAGPKPWVPIPEIIVVLLLLGALATHWRERARFDRRVTLALCSAILLAITAQLCLMWSRDATDVASASAHVVDLLCFVMLYWALVRLNLAEPYAMLFHELEGNIRSLAHEANRDQLTELYNRRGLMVLGEAQLALANRLGLRVTVIFVDVNGLKAINDEHGHTWGDQALLDTAALLRKTFRGADVLARIGGDEFVVLLVNGGGVPPVQRLRAALGRHQRKAERPYTLSLAVGASEAAPGQPDGLAEVLKAADAAMYADKEQHYAKTGDEPRD